MAGWIKLHRSIQEHWLYTEKRKFSKFEAWNDILLTVNFTEGKTIIKGKLIQIKRGESILSLDSWAKRWGWDKSAVRRFLNTLQKDNMIELKNKTITTRLIVCKYDTYQDERNANETQMKRKRNADETQMKRKRNADETHLTPIEEEEESKEEKKEKEIYRAFEHLSISVDEVEKLKYNGYTKIQIDEVLDKIENYSQNKKYSSLYITANNWLKKEEQEKAQEKEKYRYKPTIFG